MINSWFAVTPTILLGGAKRIWVMQHSVPEKTQNKERSCEATVVPFAPLIPFGASRAIPFLAVLRRVVRGRTLMATRGPDPNIRSKSVLTASTLPG